MPATPVRYLWTPWEPGGTLFEKHCSILFCEASNDINFTHRCYLDHCNEPDDWVVELGMLKWRSNLGINPEMLFMTGSGVFLEACWSSRPLQGRLCENPVSVWSECGKEEVWGGWLTYAGPHAHLCF